MEHGEIGEIVVRGRDLSPGYWRNEELTAERFTGPCNQVRTFRSGDLGRINSDGLLEFIGRRDTRVKIRGFRVEITEVEEALLRLPGVESAAVCAVERSTGDSQLTAYVVVRQGHSCTGGAARRALRPILPDHMIPAAFIFLNGLPLTPHGKIDRDKLRAIALPVCEPQSEHQPRSETELLIATIWAEAFNLTRVGRFDDFFDLGGDLLKAAVLAAAIHEATGVELNLAVMTEHSKLTELARLVEKLRLQQGTAQIPLPWKSCRIAAYRYLFSKSASGISARCHRQLLAMYLSVAIAY